MLFGRKYSPDKEAILQCWSEHFKGLCSAKHTVQKPSLAKISQVDVKLELVQLKAGTSSGTDGIPAEVYQYGGEAMLDKLQDLFTIYW